MFLEISQNSQENTCTRDSFLIKLQVCLWHRCFPVSFAKFLRKPFLKNTSGRLLMYGLGRILLFDFHGVILSIFNVVRICQEMQEIKSMKNYLKNEKYSIINSLQFIETIFNPFMTEAVII